MDKGNKVKTFTIQFKSIISIQIGIKVWFFTLKEYVQTCNGDYTRMNMFFR